MTKNHDDRAPDNTRLWARFTLDMLTNPKLLDLEPSARWAYAASILTSRRDLTDGFVRGPAVCLDQDVALEMVDVLVDRGLWHRPSHTCPDCPPVPTRPRGTVYIHDYLRHQESKAEIQERRNALSSAGKRGAAKRWQKANPKATPIARAKANPTTEAMANPNGHSIAESESEEELSLRLSSSSLSISSRRFSDDELAKITELTGGGPAHARKTADFILSKAPSEIRRPLAYVLASIADNPDAYRYRRGNPRKGQWCQQPGHEAEWADACRQCALETKLAAHNHHDQAHDNDIEPEPLEPELDEPDWTEDL